MAEEFGQVPGEVFAPGHQAHGSGEAAGSRGFSNARRRAMGLLDRAGNIASERATHQVHRISAGLRYAGEGLVTVAERSHQSGVMPDAARRVSQFSHRGADWLDSQGPNHLATSIRGYARRSPTTFFLLAIASGLVIGMARSRIIEYRNQIRSEESSS